MSELLHPDAIAHLHVAVPEAYADREELTEGEAAALALRGSNLEPTEAPTPFHIYTADGWKLPAEHELSMLDAMEKPDKKSIVAAKERHQEQLAALKEWEEADLDAAD